MYKTKRSRDYQSNNIQIFDTFISNLHAYLTNPKNSRLTPYCTQTVASHLIDID